MKEAPCGSWESPITPEVVLQCGSGKVPFHDVAIDPTTNKAYWLEILSSEKGRGAIYCKSLEGSDEPVIITKAPIDVGSRVHEYGGGSFTVFNGTIYFSNRQDNRVYKLHQDSLTPITPENKKQRFADFVVHPSGKFLVCIREEHIDDRPENVQNVLVAIDLQSNSIFVLAQGKDFYASPRFNPVNLTEMAFVSWSHPNMPWDNTELNLGTLTIQDNNISLSFKSLFNEPQSIMQPEYSPNGTLFFISDISGYWTIHTLSSNLMPNSNQDCANPFWTFNESTYQPLSDTQVICYHNNSLSILQNSTFQEISTNFTLFRQIRVFKDLVIFIGSSPSLNYELVAYSLSKKTTTSLKQIPIPPLFNGYISIPQSITFPTGSSTAHAYFYPPQNPHFTSTSLPPLRVLSHGGPTSYCTNAFSPSILYWTSRGFAVVNVNYGGSTGYGKEYRNRLKGNWGIVDVQDCCNAALYLVSENKVNRDKLCIYGGSAGGFTTLACLAFRPDVFKVGCSLYGVADLTLLMKDTHKFESRYLDGLIGKYEETKAVYEERSPINKAENIACPCIFFQGEEDRVVPKEQSELMVESLKKKGIPVSYVLYEGEGHGFRAAENIKRTLELELWFYSQIFGFEPAEKIEPIQIYGKN